jgi:hypothetical protein
MGLEQEIALLVPDQVSEIFVMVIHGRGDLTPGTIFPVQNFGNRQRQNALGRFFKGAVKHLVHFVLSHQSGRGNAQQPEQGDTQGEADAQGFL